MSTNSKAQSSRRQSAGNPISNAAGLLLSSLMVAAMTVWATSSPFSPLAPMSQQSTDGTTSDSVTMTQSVQNAFDVSESVLPSRIVESVSYEVQPESSPTILEVKTIVSGQPDDELIHREETHERQKDDRLAWLSSRRQDSLSATKPVVRTMDLLMREQMVTESTNLPEVHFASTASRPWPMQPDHREMKRVARLPNQLSHQIDKGKVNQPEAVKASTLPAYSKTSPQGQQKMASVLEFEPKKSPSLPPKKSWEIGRY